MQAIFLNRCPLAIRLCGAKGWTQRSRRPGRSRWCLCCWSHVLLPVEMHCSWSRAGIPPESLQVRRSLLGSQHIQCPGRESLSSLPSALEGRWCAASMWNSGSHPGSHRSSLGCICTQCPSSWSTPARSAGPCLDHRLRRADTCSGHLHGRYMSVGDRGHTLCLYAHCRPASHGNLGCTWGSTRLPQGTPPVCMRAGQRCAAASSKGRHKAPA